MATTHTEYSKKEYKFIPAGSTLLHTPLPPLEPASMKVLHPRPIRTYYYESVNDSVDSWARRSRAASIEGAVRAAIMRVIRRDAAHVDFYHEDGHRIGWIRREPRSKKIIVMVL